MESVENAHILGTCFLFFLFRFILLLSMDWHTNGNQCSRIHAQILENVIEKEKSGGEKITNQPAKQPDRPPNKPFDSFVQFFLLHISSISDSNPKHTLYKQYSQICIFTFIESGWLLFSLPFFLPSFHHISIHLFIHTVFILSS